MILNPKLLIVDDERGIVDMIQSYFQTQYDILTAYSGQEALKKVACKPDLILLDINMSGNGWSDCMPADTGTHCLSHSFFDCSY
ncbi:two-component response regulator [human gut metagenome]|uniref:Two-component response regulator n=1 Tax=human gut metagenome TaxID=408170 RepID=K1U209_9ZZZZ